MEIFSHFYMIRTIKIVCTRVRRVMHRDEVSNDAVHQLHHSRIYISSHVTSCSQFWSEIITNFLFLKNVTSFRNALFNNNSNITKLTTTHTPSLLVQKHNSSKQTSSCVRALANEIKSVKGFKFFKLFKRQKKTSGKNGHRHCYRVRQKITKKKRREINVN